MEDPSLCVLRPSTTSIDVDTFGNFTERYFLHEIPPSPDPPPLDNAQGSRSPAPLSPEPRGAAPGDCSWSDLDSLESDGVLDWWEIPSDYTDLTDSGPSQTVSSCSWLGDHIDVDQLEEELEEELGEHLDRMDSNMTFYSDVSGCQFSSPEDHTQLYPPSPPPRPGSSTSVYSGVSGERLFSPGDSRIRSNSQLSVYSGVSGERLWSPEDIEIPFVDVEGEDSHSEVVLDQPQRDPLGLDPVDSVPITDQLQGDHLDLSSEQLGQRAPLGPASGHLPGQGLPDPDPVPDRPQQPDTQYPDPPEKEENSENDNQGIFNIPSQWELVQISRQSLTAAREQLLSSNSPPEVSERINAISTGFTPIQGYIQCTLATKYRQI